MEYNYPYHVEPQNDAGAPGQAPAGEPKSPPKKKRQLWHLWVVLVVLIVAATGILRLIHKPQISFRRTPNGFSFSFSSGSGSHDRDSKQDNKAPSPANRQRKKGENFPTLSVHASPESAQRPLSAEAGALSLPELYERVLPSVVTITTETDQGTALGTGVILSDNGYIITNQHVVDGARAVSVQLSGGEAYDAAPVGMDEISDLAVLKIEAEKLTPAEFGDSDALRVGDSVAAIGSPLGIGLRGTLTDGIVSGISRDLTVSGRKMTLLQTNAALNTGNSGGPLINCYGQVVGINTVKLGSSSYFSGASVEGLGFAIPIATAKPIVDELIEKGYVSGRPALGVQVESLPLRARFYYNLPDGAYLTYVEPSSDAAAKGLRKGDIITAVGSVPVIDAQSLRNALSDYSAGDTVTVGYFRSGSYYTADIVLMDRYDAAQ